MNQALRSEVTKRTVEVRVLCFMMHYDTETLEHLYYSVVTWHTTVAQVLSIEVVHHFKNPVIQARLRLG
jgi:hypothetical protein